MSSLYPTQMMSVPVRRESYGSTSILDPLDELASHLTPTSTAFFFDVDGTLIDIAPHPDAVEVPPSLLEDLSTLSLAAGGALALVSGREASVLDRLFAPLRLPVSGVHGAQFRALANGEIEDMTGPLDADLRAQLASLSGDFEGLLVEDKGASVALHYRSIPAVASDLEEAVARIVAPRARNVAVLPGRMVFEVKHRGHDKGAAVRAFMGQSPFAGRTPIFFGDDVTDEAGFAAVREMGGLAISVGRRLPGADMILDDASAVRDLVRRLGRSADRRG